MNVSKPGILIAVSLALFLSGIWPNSSWAQDITEAPTVTITSSSTLDLAPEKVSHLQAALAQHDYLSAEQILLDQINTQPHSIHSAALLAYIGSVYFLNRDYVNAAIAWKKSDAIKPLEPGIRFSLAMAYVQMAHPDWARAALKNLAEQDGRNALYAYWLGRLDYDAHRYPEAIDHLTHALAIDPKFARAFDSLGLCYFYENRNELAVTNFEQAIKLDQSSQHPSAWPYLNLAETLQLLGETARAEINVREAIRLDPQSAPAHYRLGKLLEDQEKLEDEISELQAAVLINPKYAEAHVALAHVYNRLKQKDAAEREVQIYRGLHSHGPISKAP